jgi:hypothetical protein
LVDVAAPTEPANAARRPVRQDNELPDARRIDAVADLFDIAGPLVSEQVRKVLAEVTCDVVDVAVAYPAGSYSY